MQHPSPNLVLLGSDTPTTWIIYNRLVQEFGPFPALVEQRISRRKLLANRLRKLGLRTTLAQVAFAQVIRPFLNAMAKPRVTRICRREGLERVRPISADIMEIDSANGAFCEQFLRNAQAGIIIVNGTRILRPHILKATPAVFINTHQGITPQYRGAHGAYWALLQGDPEHCGVTVHLVDDGIDTGNIIAQSRIATQSDDCFMSYPYLQTAAAMPLLLTAIRDIMKGTLHTKAIEGASRVWYHPGFFTYLLGMLRRGVR